jgi:hypothetical protein
MVRADRNRPDVYFGRPGSLVKMPYPRGDMERPYDRQVFDFETGAGQHAISSLMTGSRLYSVTWNALHADNYALIEQYWTGMMGTGPWVLIDPSMPNMLLQNQAAATNLMNISTSFVTSTGAADMGTIFSNTATTLIHRSGATRNVRWQFTVAAATTPVLTLATPYRNWFGFPVVPTLSYAWSSWARPDGVVDSSITMAMKIQWYDSTGVQIGSDVSGGDVVMTTWTQMSVTAVAPTGAAYAKPIFVVTGSTVTTGASIYIDELQLEQDTVVNTWAPGTGLRPVEIVSLSETVPFNARFRKGLTMVLRELAA